MTSSGTGLDEGISNPASAVLEYEVFLSFRGPDTRYNITSHLYAKLIDSGIRVYKDDEKLRTGAKIGPGLRQGIEQSKIAVPILSKGYAASRWCLDELVFVMERMRQGSLIVKPIFYDVTPSQVRKQAGSYEEAFESHMKNHDEKTISEWKKALIEVAQVKGWNLQSDTKIDEAKLVKDVVKEVWDELKRVDVLINDDVLVGLEEHVEEILSKINAERSSVGSERMGVRVLGIYGMGGIGKTTLAEVIYNHLSPHFKDCSFVADIRKNFQTKGIRFLLKKLISDILSKEAAYNIGTRTDLGFHIIKERFCDRKVLILLDDVDNIDQIERLMKECKWFSLESIIIITTRHKGILQGINVDWLYELHVMQDQYAHELFIKRAFQNNKPPEDYGELIAKAVRISGGLPLCLEVIGSLLHNQSKEVWECTLEKLEKVPHEDVKKSLRISFEALDARQQQILLDIASFFIGVDRKMAIHFWDGLNLYPKEAIIVLQQRSLIKIGADNLIRMHDQMRDFCRDYIDEVHIGEPERQRILWNQEDAARIFMRKMEAESIVGLFLQFDMQSQWLCTAENFAKLSNLKFLQVKSDDISQAISLFGRRLRAIARLFSLLRGNPPTLSKLRWLYWRHFPPTYDLNIFSFQNLVFLDLSESCISDGWDRRSHIKTAKRLKVLNLSGCKKLTRTPNFPENLPLEQLILEGCSSLIELDSSIRMLKHLHIINLRGCGSLCKLPTGFGDIKSLVEIILDDTSLSKLPKYIRDLERLSLLSLRNMSSIQALPKSITALESLVQLDLSYSGIVELPDSIDNMKNLEILNIDGCHIRELPTSLGMLERLEVISADECRHLESIPNLPYSLISLTVRSQARMKRIPDFSNLTSLEHLIAFFIDVPCDQPENEIIWNIGKLSELVDLKVRFPHIQILHGDLGELSNLKELVLEKCRRLRGIPKLPSNLRMLRVNYCRLLKSLPDLSHLKRLRGLHIEHTPIDKIEGLQMLENLRKLVLVQCDIQRLPDMSNLKNLKVLEVKFCRSLVEIQGRSLESMEELDLFNCISLEKMPDILNKETMNRFNIVDCGKFSSAEDEYPTTIEHKQAADHFMKMFHENLPTIELFVSNCIISLSFFLSVLAVLAPMFFGFKPQRLSWLGIFLLLINLFIASGLHSMILEVMSCRRLVGIQARSLESSEELDMLDCTSLEKMPDIPNKETTKRFNIVDWGIFENPTTIEHKQAVDDFMKIFQEKDAEKNLFESNFVAVPILLLPILLSAPKFLGLEPCRLSWLGVFLLFILGGLRLYSTILEAMSYRRLVGIEGRSSESLEELDMLDCNLSRGNASLTNKKTKGFSIVNRIKFLLGRGWDPTTIMHEEATNESLCMLWRMIFEDPIIIISILVFFLFYLRDSDLDYFT